MADNPLHALNRARLVNGLFPGLQGRHRTVQKSAVFLYADRDLPEGLVLRELALDLTADLLVALPPRLKAPGECLEQSGFV